MSRFHKTVTTIWTTLLAAPILVMLFEFSRMECGEYDPCSTGGPMPFAPAAVFLLIAATLAQAAILVMIWKDIPASEE